MTKFKVGNKVRVIKHTAIDSIYGRLALENLNCVGVITSCVESLGIKLYYVSFDDKNQVICWYLDTHLRLVI